MKRIAVTLLVAAGCTGDVDMQWDLDHDRIIAVKLDKPGLLAGETTEIHGLVGMKNAAPMQTQEAPPLAVIVPDLPGAPPTPDALKATVSTSGGKWYVTAPDQPTIDALRTQLMLMPTDPIVVTLGFTYGATLNGITEVRFGVDAQNPAIDMPTLNAMPLAADATPVIDSLVDVPLSITIPENQDINWLTGVGQMHDFDLPSAYIRVEKGDPLAGQLAVVIRDRLGGVDWQIWNLTANPPPATTGSN